jgi:hypothetical protein
VKFISYNENYINILYVCQVLIIRVLALEIISFLVPVADILELIGATKPPKRTPNHPYPKLIIKMYIEKL